jgi:catechol 2,3-dioxygenase-like lactoylglutathione lyase family enzyme
MRLVPIIYVTDIQRAVAFYSALGADVGPTGINAYWTEMTLHGSTFALHIHGAFGDVCAQRLGLSLIAEQPLETIAAGLAEHAIHLDRGITDESFGRSMVVRDPDGLAIQINEHDSTRHAG